MTRRYFDLKKVTDAAAGNWLEIFLALAPSLEEACRFPGKHVTDPVNGTRNANGRGDGFRLFKDAIETGGSVSNRSGEFPTGFHTLMFVNDWEFRDALEYVADYLNLPPDYVPKEVAFRKKPVPKVNEEKRAEVKAAGEQANAEIAAARAQAEEYNRHLWEQSQRLDQGVPPAILRYLKGRGVDLRRSVLGDNIRYMPNLAYYQDDDKGIRTHVGDFPAMISALRSSEGVEVLHRTYLDFFGHKADVPKPKKLCISPGNLAADAAIRLGGMPVDGVLGYAEGIETALSAIKAHGIPVWATYSANMLATRVPPAGVHTVVIYADKDRPCPLRGIKAGEHNANQLKSRLQAMGMTCYVMLPPGEIPEGKKSLDWNDILLTKGVDGFMPYLSFRHMVNLRSQERR